MADGEKNYVMNIALALILIATAGLLVYATKDWFLTESQKTVQMSSTTSFASFDESIMKNGMASKANIGNLGSQHIHADFKVFVNGHSIDFAENKYYMKSGFLHLDDNQNKQDASGVLHIHATGVPLWIFFRSIGMDFNKDCITLETQQKFCNDGNKKLKFFINGKENNDFENYVFKDLDKILISYGDENEEQIRNQLNSITNFASLHSK